MRDLMFPIPTVAVWTRDANPDVMRKIVKVAAKSHGCTIDTDGTIIIPNEDIWESIKKEVLSIFCP